MIVYGNSSLLFIAITFLISLALVLLLTKALDLLFCTSSVAVPIIFILLIAIPFSAVLWAYTSVTDAILRKAASETITEGTMIAITDKVITYIDNETNETNNIYYNGADKIKPKLDKNLNSGEVKIITRSSDWGSYKEVTYNIPKKNKRGLTICQPSSVVMLKRRLKMELNKFTEKLLNVLSERGITVSTKEVRKGFTTRTWIAIKSNSPTEISPLIPVDEVLALAINHDATMEEAADFVMQIHEAKTVKVNIDIKNYDAIKDYLLIRLVNKESYDLDENTVAKPYLDLIKVLSLLVPVNSDNFVITVTKEMLKDWNKSEDEIFADAGNSSVMAPIVREMPSAPDYIETGVTITNPHAHLGASVILANDKSLLKQIADEKGKDLLIMPSSVHEVIVTPITDRYDILKETLKYVNDTILRSVDILSYNIYKYDRLTGEILVL